MTRDSKDSNTSNGACRLDRRPAAADLFVLALIWGAAVLIANPAGNFPLNDDWSYGLAVKRLLVEHSFRPTGWTAMPLLTNVLWGALFCLPKGFSFAALRGSTLVLSFVGVAATYLLVRSIHPSRPLAMLAAIIVGLNPLYFALSHTFMTDVPFTAIVLLSVLGFARNLVSRSRSSLALGTLLAVVACLSRQLGLAIPLGFALVVLLTQGLKAREFLRALVPLVACVAVLCEFHAWLASSGRLPALYDAQTARLLHRCAHPVTLAAMGASQARASLLYLGLFLLPISIFPAWRVLRSRSGFALFGGTLLLLVGLGGISAVHGHPFLMPVLENVLAESGIGPVTLGSDLLPPLPRLFWVLVTGLCYFGAALLASLLIMNIVRVARTLRRGTEPNDRELIALFALTVAAVYLAPLVMNELLDRYLIPAIPLLIVALAELDFSKTAPVSPFPRVLRPSASLLVAAFAVFSICTTRDYLAWNRARWRALDFLTDQMKVKDDEVDGGFEFRELHAYAASDRLKETDVADGSGNEMYKLGFEAAPGYNILKEYAYRVWIPPHHAKIFILQKQP